MRLTAPSRRSTIEQQREQSRRRRVSAGTLAETFPAATQVRIQLDFQDETDRPPVGQLHDLFPPAPAFFEYACPHGDCDGILELGEAVSAMLSRSLPGAEGRVPCPGTRTSAPGSRRPCELVGRYRVNARYE